MGNAVASWPDLDQSLLMTVYDCRIPSIEATAHESYTLGSAKIIARQECSVNIIMGAGGREEGASEGGKQKRHPYQSQVFRPCMFS